MKLHTTNYQDTFIAVADDCPVAFGEVPPQKGDAKSVANLQFEILSKNPYKYTSDDVIFNTFALRKDITESEYEDARNEYFSKGQACLRASPLTKRYGWGVHSNSDGKIAIYPRDSAEYQKFMNDESIKVVKAMKSSR